MNNELYDIFLTTGDTLRIYDGDTLVFSSTKERLVPLMEYITTGADRHKSVIIFDKVMGNAAALLSVKANAREVRSPLGSELAVRTLKKHDIGYYLDTTVSFILRADGVRMCPMEELSIDKEPDEFYMELKARMEATGTADSY